MSYVDLKYRVGCIPLFWQLLKNMHELGHNNIVVPYAGENVETLWWEAEENPGLFYSSNHDRLNSDISYYPVFFSVLHL